VYLRILFEIQSMEEEPFKRIKKLYMTYSVVIDSERIN
jgi:hypothetical protein